MKTKYELHKSINFYLNKMSSYKQLSEYFRFLVSNNSEICKSSSGSLRVLFPGLYDHKISIVVELYGYDTLTLSTIEFIEGENEEEIKDKVIKLFEIERLALIKNTEKE